MAEAALKNPEFAADDGGAFMESVIAQATGCLNETGKADMNSRLLQVMPIVLRRLHELVREIQLTEPELMAVLEKLTEIGKHEEMVLLSDVLGASVHANFNTYGEDFEGNRASVEGPYYIEGSELKPDGDIASDDEPGTHLNITGRVIDARTGSPIPGAVLDVWQTNDAAEYDLDGFHLRGKVKADGEGRYRLHTIKPAGYSIGTAETPTADLIDALGRRRMRPGHIHVKAFADGYRDLTTQIFFEGDPLLGNDAIFSVTDNLVVDPETDDQGWGHFEFDIAMVPRAA